MSLPKTYKAAVFEEVKGKLVLKDVPLKEPEAGQILIRVEACGVCHSDLMAQMGAIGSLPRVPGHEVVGTIVAIGPGEKLWKMCVNEEINGITRDGGYAEYCLLRSEAAVRIPEGKASEIAPLLCAGVTVFNGIRRMDVGPGEIVAIQGMGGLGHLALQYSSKMGYITVAISHGSDKRQFAKQLGATHYIDTETQDPAAELQKLGGAALVVATAPSPQAISPLVNGCAPLGKVLVLAPVGDLTVNTVAMINRGISVHGWPSGHQLDSEEAIAFAQNMGVKCMVEEFPLERAQEAYEHMLGNKARFRAVIVMK